jgi:hypothetical protein
VIGGAVRGALKEEEPSVRQPGAVREPGQVQLGAQVVMVEDEAGSLDRAEGESQRPEDVWRVAGLDDREPAPSPRLERVPRGRQEGVRVLHDEPELAATGCVRTVFVQLHTVDDLVPGVAFALWAHDGNPVALPHQGLAFEPHPPVEWHREILDNYQHSWLHDHMSRWRAR